MMKSIGVDIEEVNRFKSLVRNKRFLNRVFSKEEIAYCRSKKNQYQHFAVRFAAKEAVWKALSETLTRSKKKISHKDISVKNTSAGKPTVHLPKAFSKLKNRVLISLSHTKLYAVAMAVYRG